MSPRLELSSINNFTFHRILCLRLNHHRHHTTINKKHIPHFHIIDKIIVVHTNTICSSNTSLNSKSEFLPRIQYNRLWQIPTPNFRTLSVKHDCNHIVLALSIIFLNQVNDFLMRSMVPMRHIQSSHVHPSFSQLPNHFLGIGRWSNGTHDLCLAPKRGLRPHPSRILPQWLHPT
ncbi:hypothetical protein V8G54_011181 [Vigna mungo]|uniref:Uncharacterized protein n=1 Tax=Vigna mungo TaxID=3915 RepID=A0AAQ3NQY6_VIGMU